MITRREFIRNTAATGVLAGTSGLAMPAIAQNAPIKLGYVSRNRARWPPSPRPTSSSSTVFWPPPRLPASTMK